MCPVIGLVRVLLLVLFVEVLLAELVALLADLVAMLAQKQDAMSMFARQPEAWTVELALEVWEITVY